MKNPGTKKTIGGARKRPAAFGASEAEVRYKALFDQSPDGILLIDTRGNFLEFNESAHRQLNYTREEFSRLSISDIDPFESPEEIQDRIRQVLENGKAEFTVRHRTKKGDIRDVYVITQVLTISRKTFFHTIWRDITEHKRADEALKGEKNFTESALNILEDVFFVFDMEGKFVRWNRALTSVTGYRNEEVSSMSPADFFPPEEKHRVAEAIRTVFETGRARLEAVILTKDGRSIPFEFTGTLLRDFAGNLLVSGTGRDITDRVNTEKALREGETRYRELFELESDAIFLVDRTTGQLLECNKAAEDLYGYSRAELLNLTVNDVSAEPEKSRQVIKEGFEKIRLRWHRKRDGTVFPVEITGRFFKHGESEVHLAAIRDISERLRTEQTLRESEEKIRSLSNNFPKGYIYQLVRGTDGWKHFTYLSKGAEKIHGLSVDEVLQNPMLLYNQVVEEDRDMLSRADEEASRTMANFSAEVRIRRPDGTIIWLDLRASSRRLPDGRTLTDGLATDITERKLSQSALAANEKLLRTIIDAEPECVKLLAPDGTLITMNPAGLAMIDAGSLDLIQGRSMSDLVASEYRDAFKKLNQKVFEGGAGSLEFEAVGLRGRKIWLETNAVPLRNEKDEIIALLGITRDITERKRAESALRESEAFLRSVLDNVDEGFLVISPDYRIVTVNKAYCQQVGLRCDDIVGRHCYTVSHKSLKPCYEKGEECAVRHVLETGEPGAALHRHQEASGAVIYVETKAFPLKNSEGKVISVVETIANITEKQLLEEERLKTQKLEAIGTLAGGIAHDFRNLLQGVFGYMSMARMNLDRKDTALSLLEQAEKALQMSVSLTAQLLTFSKGGQPVKKRLDLASVIETSARFALSGSRSNYRFTHDEDLWPVEADEGQIGQVIQNIVLNANEAMAGGGTVMIHARNVDARKNAESPQAGGEKFVSIDISDSGIGIPEHYLSKIFDPYFTTKQKGSGLGLATSYSIVKNHGGTISVKSSAGKGSTFSIYIPAAEPIKDKELFPPPVALAHRNGRVLVMDDEEVVRLVAARMLESLGHRATCVEDGEEALEIFEEARKTGKPFDVVILDLTVKGGMGGEATASRLLKIDPEVKIIVSSGYSDSPVASDYLSHGFASFLHKPYTIEALGECLNALLPPP